MSRYLSVSSRFLSVSSRLSDLLTYNCSQKSLRSLCSFVVSVVIAPLSFLILFESFLLFSLVSLAIKLCQLCLSFQKTRS